MESWEYTDYNPKKWHLGTPDPGKLSVCLNGKKHSFLNSYKRFEGYINNFQSRERIESY